MVILVPPEVLARPPSREDGIDADTENQLRRFGAELIRRAGFLLKLPQFTVASAATMFQRFYFRKSFAEFEVRSLATAALALASKLEEHPRKLQEVIQAFYRLQMRELKEDDGTPSYGGRPTPHLDVSQREFADVKTEVVRAERSILRELGFEVKLVLEHPHRYVLEYVDLLKGRRMLAQKAWAYLNDSLGTTLCCSHQPDEIAAASLFLAARSLGLKLPSKPPWWEALGTKKKDAEHIALTILALYSKPAAEHIAIPRRKKEMPETPVGPSTPFPTTPAPMKSPSDEDDRPDDSEPAPAPVREDGPSLDQSRIAELLEEDRGGKEAPHVEKASPPASPRAGASPDGQAPPKASQREERKDRGRARERERDRRRNGDRDRGRGGRASSGSSNSVSEKSRSRSAKNRRSRRAGAGKEPRGRDRRAKCSSSSDS